jgi:hypothetical protein
MHEAQVIGEFGKVRQQVRNHFPAFAPRLERPQRLDEIAVRTLKRHQTVATRQRLIVPLDQLGLIVPRIDVTERARAENHQHLLGTWFEMRLSRRVRFFRRKLRPDRVGATSALLIS